MAKREAAAKISASKGVGPLLSVQDLSGMLQVPVRTLYFWRYRGEGPRAIRVGRFLRYDPEEVALWVDGRKAAGGARHGRF